MEDKTLSERNDVGRISRHAVPDERNGPPESTGHVFTHSDPQAVRRNSNNPFYSLFENTLSPRDTSVASDAAPFVSPVAPNISLRTNHVGGSSSTISKVDNSTRQNFNNVTHNVTTNFNGSIFIPGSPVFGFYPPSGCL